MSQGARAGPHSAGALGFVLRTTGLLLVGLVLLAVAPSIERTLIGATILSLGALSAILGIDFAASGATVRVAGASMVIIADCTPVMAILVLWSAVTAFPAAFRWRLVGALAGAAALWVYNVLRVLALGLLLRHRPEWFDLLHVYLWQSLSLLFVLALFAAWVEIVRSTGATR